MKDVSLPHFTNEGTEKKEQTNEGTEERRGW